MTRTQMLKAGLCVFAVACLVAGTTVSIRAQSATGQAAAQTIDELVARALQTAPGALAARARTEAARGELAQAALRPNPSLSFERRDEVGGADSQTSVGITWPLDLFRRDGRLAVARAGVDAAALAAAERDRVVAAEVRVIAARLIAARQLLAVREDVAAANRRTLELIAARVETGAAPPVERDVAAVEAARADADVLRQRADTDMMASSLRARVGLLPDDPLRLVESLEDLAVSTAAAAGAPGGEIDARPDIRLANADITRALAKQDLARREGRADVSVFAGYMRMNAGFPQFGLNGSGQPEPISGRFHNVAAGVMVMLPWRNRNQGAIAAAAAEAEAARHERDARRIDALNDLDALRRREASARDAVAIFSRGTRALAAKNVDVMRESYQLGRATLLDVLTETRRYLDLESAYVATLLELVDARVALAAALGGGRDIR